VHNIILQQKQEKEILLGQKLLDREQLPGAKKHLKTKLIKAIIGPRRAGKSVFAMLLLKDKYFAYVNFDDDNLAKISNSDEIIEAVIEVYGDPQYILFDEIQNLPNWELFVNKLHRRGYNLILTGSNAKLLSKELATALTGRNISIEILPLGFREFLRVRKFNSATTLNLPERTGKILNLLTEYLNTGGFPEVVIKGVDLKSYLGSLFDSILLKDIVKRYKIRQTQKIYDLAIYLISNFASEASFTKLKNTLQFSSVHTLQNYFRYLEETYLFFALTRFDFKVKEQIKAPKKIYLVDNGLIQAKSLQHSRNLDKKMENLVFIELLRKGYKPNLELFYYKTRNQKEVDFVVRKGTKTDILLQVAYILDADVEKREINALCEASQELRCNKLIILTWDLEKSLKHKQKSIQFVPLWKWILGSSLHRAD
jgi:predicted AAA+ superfamily ATPase